MYSPFAGEKDDLELGENKVADNLKIDSMVEVEYLDSDTMTHKKDVNNMVDSGFDYVWMTHQYQSYRNFVKH